MCFGPNSQTDPWEKIKIPTQFRGTAKYSSWIGYNNLLTPMSLFTCRLLSVQKKICVPGRFRDAILYSKPIVHALKWSVFFTLIKTQEERVPSKSIILLLYKRHFYPRFTYFKPTFWSSKNFLRDLFCEIMSLCTVTKVAFSWSK